MIPTSFPDQREMARLTARMLLEIQAVHFKADEPFILASGKPSPTYIDCRTADLLSAHPQHCDGFSHRDRDAQRRI